VIVEGKTAKGRHIRTGIRWANLELIEKREKTSLEEAVDALIPRLKVCLEEQKACLEELEALRR
jgi:hypothetical protein